MTLSCRQARQQTNCNISQMPFARGWPIGGHRTLLPDAVPCMPASAGRPMLTFMAALSLQQQQKQVTYSKADLGRQVAMQSWITAVI